MKVLFWSSGLRPVYGGPCFSESLLCQYLATDCDVTVLVQTGRKDDAFCQDHGLAPIEVSLWDCVIARWFRRHPLSRLVAETDLLHTNGHWRMPIWWLTRLARRSRIPYVVHPRGMLLVGHRRIVIKKVYNFLFGGRIVRQAARVVALSQFETRHFAPYRLRSSQIAVIPNSVSGPAQSSVDKITRNPFFLYFGRIESRKNLIFLVDAFAAYHHAGGRTELLLIGPPERGYDDLLRSHIQRHKLGNAAQILAPVYDGGKWAYLAAARAVVYPAREEPFGRVPFEALAMGSMPLVPKQSGGAEYLAPLLPLSTYDQDSAESLTEKLLALDQPRETWAEPLRKAREWQENKLSPRAIASRFATLYREITADKS